MNIYIVNLEEKKIERGVKWNTYIFFFKTKFVCSFESCPRTLCKPTQPWAHKDSPVFDSLPLGLKNDMSQHCQLDYFLKNFIVHDWSLQKNDEEQQLGKFTTENLCIISNIFWEKNMKNLLIRIVNTLNRNV